MKKILDKWYFSLIIIPILINISTGIFDYPTLLENWNYTVIGTLIIAIIILVFELISATKELKRIKRTPKESDKKIIKDLIETLDVTRFQNDIVSQSCWYGFSRKSIKNVHDFIEKSELLIYKTNDSVLNEYINRIKLTLIDFSDLASSVLYADNDKFYTPDKNHPVEREKLEEISPKVDKLSDKAFQVLEETLGYLKRNNYLENTNKNTSYDKDG